MTTSPRAARKPADSAEACGQRGRLAEVAAKANAVDPGVLAGEIRDHLPGTIRAAIVHEVDFHLQLGLTGRLGNLVQEQGQAFLLVVHRNDDGDHVNSP
jgi:hypothetical protein